ncbi:MAG: DUF6531 domain-containing protein, partial [Alphaproteobacteria bacterium]|nr:DUF6531 domain-containing protein [Alphaproteobacteria bacterium]
MPKNNNKKWLSLFVVMLLSVIVTPSYASSFNGTWSGKLTQPGGPYTTYDFSLNNFVETAGSVTGTSYIMTSAGDWAQMSLTGTVTGSQISFSESAIVAQSGALTWCIKSGTLTLSGSGEILSGSWSTTTPSCTANTGSITTRNAIGKGLGDPNCTYQGQRTGGTDPISLGSGNHYEQINDYHSSGTNILEFTRYYNSSAAPSSVPSMVDSRWRTTYDRYVNIHSSTEVMLERADGLIIYFEYDSCAIQSKTDANLNVSLTQTGSGIGSTWEFT